MLAFQRWTSSTEGCEVTLRWSAPVREVDGPQRGSHVSTIHTVYVERTVEQLRKQHDWPRSRAGKGVLTVGGVKHFSGFGTKTCNSTGHLLEVI